MTEKKYIYSFGGGGAEGNGELAPLLGGKGAGLAEMSLLGIPVPPGFTLTTEACTHYHQNQSSFPDGLEEQLEHQLESLERGLGQVFGSPEAPLLVSVRSGGMVSMPGMMDTILNLGLNREIVEAMSDDAQAARFFRDCYRRLLAMFGDVVRGIPGSEFERAMAQPEVLSITDPVERLDRTIAAFEALFERHGTDFPQDPKGQLWAAVGAVFDSWNNRRAKEYRRLHDIADDLGTGVTVQAMVFGNRGEDCATGVAFTRDPSTGVAELYGEFLLNAQGEDLVAGTHTPRSIKPSRDGAEPGLASVFPEAFGELTEICEVLERHFRNMQDLEFTIQHGKLFLLQTRAGKRSGPAAVRIAVDMVRERLIDRREALRRVEPQHLIQMMAPEFDAAERKEAVAQGRLLALALAAGPGAASGRIAFTAERATEMAVDGSVLLVRDETSPEDIVGMHASSGILTTRGGMTSHAAVVARGLGKPCIVGADELTVDDEEKVLRVAGKVFREGDFLAIDGSRGEVIEGRLETHPSAILQALLDGSTVDQKDPSAVAIVNFEQILQWSDRERRLGVRANADTPEDARVARVFGAEGIGLCRTEHMFFQGDRIPWVRRMILAHSGKDRADALSHLLPIQQADFEGIFEALAGLPVTIRLLDPPLHEFLPKSHAALESLAEKMSVPYQELHDKVEAIIETNPMLGHRGCRLGVTAPEIYEMQVRAIVLAACAVASRGLAVQPEIMIPLVGVEEELALLRSRVEGVIDQVLSSDANSAALSASAIRIGTMIEIPRAALTADRIAQHADFFSFGTNDLTQMTFGFSRDDAGRFLPEYLDGRILPFNPFERIDRLGVGELVRMAARRGRMARPGLKLGVCGEHGGDPHSIEFFEECKLDYVSCSPYRVPIARLAAARATLAFGAGGRAPGLDDSAAASSNGAGQDGDSR